MLDRVSHSVQKEQNAMFAARRSSSAQRSRNPLIPTDCDEEKFRANRGKVPDYLVLEKRMAERPRGLAKGEFRSQGEGSFKLSYDEPPVVRPYRKLISAQGSPEHKPKSKKIFGRPSTSNPITQDDAKFESTPVRPRATQNYYSSVFSETAPPERPVSKPVEGYSKRNASSIFTQGSSDVFQQHKRHVEPWKSPVAGSLLKYEYALPYREVPITGKPAENRAILQDYRN
mmetsp:Transcript_28544/g.50718  ORF Transcript_28544/g.50718 Transcript_28544/m.50718 type:complete len:229 (-) Transcript_28544:197-883(-)